MTIEQAKEIVEVKDTSTNEKVMELIEAIKLLANSGFEV